MWDESNDFARKRRWCWGPLLITASLGVTSGCDLQRIALPSLHKRMNFRWKCDSLLYLFNVRMGVDVDKAKGIVFVVECTVYRSTQVFASNAAQATVTGVAS
jgi:hypothetical protein